MIFLERFVGYVSCLHLAKRSLFDSHFEIQPYNFQLTIAKTFSSLNIKNHVFVVYSLQSRLKRDLQLIVFCFY